jgi:hypothetical protein
MLVVVLLSFLLVLLSHYYKLLVMFKVSLKMAVGFGNIKDPYGAVMNTVKLEGGMLE